MRTTIDYGIDLGTTNSSIAVLKGTTTEVIRNNRNDELTPSVVWEGKTGGFVVGRRAYERIEIDPENTCAEFKLKMGMEEDHVFNRSGKSMTPEDLSAEVLKDLRRTVQQRKGEEIRAAVISVPASFELPQCEATNKAAKLAGLETSPLVQEPVAAAMAYGFQDESDKVFWLVYDLGGGTFDAAIIQVRDGIIQVINHGGDNHLGGKLLDWEIVQKIFVPDILNQYDLKDFSRGNSKWKKAFAKLKIRAEKAKIELSWNDSTTGNIDYLFQDDSGSPVDYEYELNRTQLEPLMEPYILRSIKICKRVLEEKRLDPKDIEKLIMVGGPTLTPYLRERILDTKDGLGIPLEYSIDPLTVVSRGAAIFAGTQRLEMPVSSHEHEGAFRVDLEYKPMGPDIEPLVGGKVIAPGEISLSGFTIEFINKTVKKAWKSGKVSLDSDGVFMTELWAEKGVQNIFQIELCDEKGDLQEVSPEEIKYTVGQVITDPPLIHSLGVALANNNVAWLLEKGAALPARNKPPLLLRTATSIRAGETVDLLRIPVVEGEKTLADRNSKIGTLEVPGEKIKRDIPIGAEVEITVEVDASRLVRTKAYVPILDEEYEEVMTLRSEKPDEEGLREDIKREQNRLDQLRERATEIDDPDANQKLQDIDRQEIVEHIEVSIEAAKDDSDALIESNRELRELQDELDVLENVLEWPSLCSDAERQIEATRVVMDDVEMEGTSDDHQSFRAIQQEIQDAIEAHDADLLRRKTAQMQDLRFKVIVRHPGFWVGYLDHLKERRSNMVDQKLADDLFTRADRAILQGDVESLKTAVSQLMNLLPAEVRAEVEEEAGYGSTVI